MLIGNAVIGQSGGPTAAINATLAGVIRRAYKYKCINNVYGMFNGIEGFLEERICKLENLDIELLSQTPSSALGSCRMKLPKDDPEIFEKFFSIIKKYDIRYFFYIGGNDSMDTVAKLHEFARTRDYDLRVIGIPKTIDNDLMCTDHTPGYGSAAKYIAASMQEIIRDCAVYTLKAVTIVEIMGRDTGWLTAAAALPKIICGVAPDYVYLPERAFDVDKFLGDIKKAFEIHPNVVVAVSEGLRTAEGKFLGEATHKGTDIFGHVNLSGAGKTLELLVKGKIGCKVRSVELNILQRCAAHIASLTDIFESIKIGEIAVKTAVNGVSGVMMSFDGSEITTADVSQVANKIKYMPDDFINEAGNFVTDKCLKYIKPLIQGEMPVKYKDGLPLHLEINC